MARQPLRLRIAKAVLGSKAKAYIPNLASEDFIRSDDGSRLKNYFSKADKLTANIGWAYAANTAIVEACAAVELKLYRKDAKGNREEVTDHELLDLLDSPNFAHTGEQLRQLHFTYMNFTGESYILMLKAGHPFTPAKGQLPDALQIIPSHQASFELGETYTKSVVKFGQEKYPITAFIRDLNPDPGNPYNGRSVIAAAAAAIDTDDQMKEWNRRFFANNARPGLIFSSNEELSDDAYRRFQEQFSDEHTGTENAHKPLFVEGGDAKPYMLSQTDLDFLDSRKFSKDEILAMWRTSPAILGMTENVNRSNMEGAMYIQAVINTVPRVRQFVRQFNATLVKVYDPTLFVDYVNPVPEDQAAKLNYADKGVNKWLTIDETREYYGEDELPDGLGAQLYMPATVAPLSAVADGTARPAPVVAPPAVADPELDPEDQSDPKTGKSLAGVKKNS